jgi:hypothetical protein
MATSTLPTTSTRSDAIVAATNLSSQDQPHSEPPRATSSVDENNMNAMHSAVSIHCGTYEQHVTTSKNNNNNNNKEGRLKDLKLMEYYLNLNQLCHGKAGVLVSASSSTDDTGSCVFNLDSEKTQTTSTDFESKELLHQHLLRQHDANDDDEQLISQILFQTTGIMAPSNSTNVNHTSTIQRHSSITGTDTNKTFAFSLPKTSSYTRCTSINSHILPPIDTYSRCSSINVLHDTALPTAADSNCLFSSCAWKPILQTDHQEIAYSPDKIFQTTVNATHPSTVAVAHTITVQMEPLSAGADTLLLAAQVLHEKTNRTTDKTLLNNLETAVTEKKPKARKGRTRTRRSKKDIPDTTEQPKILKLIPDNDITKNDVLLGRGGRTNHHVGNARYRHYKETLQERYLVASKDEKSRIANELVQMIYSCNGRFLNKYDPNQSSELNENGSQKTIIVTCKKQCSKNESDDSEVEVDYWYEVDMKVARTKASQALREINTPENRAAKRAKYSSKKS